MSEVLTLRLASSHARIIMGSSNIGCPEHTYTLLTLKGRLGRLPCSVEDDALLQAIPGRVRAGLFAASCLFCCLEQRLWRMVVGL